MSTPPARLYECEVMHHRLRPVQRSFTYRVFMLDLDLDSLPATIAATRGLAHNRFGLFSINDSDHIDLGLPGGIRANLVEWLSRQGVEVPANATVRLVTFPRTLGYGFNPVSFYYIHREDGSPLLAVAEVVNTYREMKLYIVDGGESAGLWHRRVAKDFYVSPFSSPADVFDFRLGIPGHDWRVDIDDRDAQGEVLISSIRGVARPLTSARLIGYALKFPLLSLKIIAAIHWQALLLWLRRTPYFRKSDRTDAQREVLRPHRSLNQDPS